MNRIDLLTTTIKCSFPTSSLQKVDSNILDAIELQYRSIPQDVRTLYLELGYGSIGDGHFQIHCFLEPADIYDADTAKRLDGILIVGDDFAGTCYAYDTTKNWTFGCIDNYGEFDALTDSYVDFVEFLKRYITD